MMISAIVSGTSFSSYFRQVTDEQYVVTGGYLNKIYDTSYLPFNAAISFSSCSTFAVNSCTALTRGTTNWL